MTVESLILIQQGFAFVSVIFALLAYYVLFKYSFVLKNVSHVKNVTANKLLFVMKNMAVTFLAFTLFLLTPRIPSMLCMVFVMLIVGPLIYLSERIVENTTK